MSRYLKHFMAGVRADVQQLVMVDFEALDPQAVPNLFDAVTILKIGQKTLPPHVWKQCGAYRNGLINYKAMNSYLESQLGMRQRTELSLRRQWTLEKKKQTLTDCVEIPSLVKKKPGTQSRQLPAPIIGGAQPFTSPLLQF